MPDMVKQAKRVTASLLALVALSGLVAINVQADNAEVPVDKVKAETPGKMTSQQIQVETLEPGSAIITPAQVKEAILDVNINTLSTDCLVEAKDIYDNWKESAFDPFEDKLRGIEGFKEERVPFCARVWYCRNYSWSHADGIAKFQDYLHEADIIDYVKGGKNPNVICDNEGNPRVWVVVKDKKHEQKALKLFKEAIEWYKKNKMPDMLKSASENGLSVFFVANTDFDRGPDSVWLNQWGEICLNQNSENVKGIPDKNLRNQFIRALIVEPYGIIFQQITTALKLWDAFPVNVSHAEVVKSLVAGYVSGDLKGTDKDGIYEIFADSFPQKAIRWAQQGAKRGTTVDGVLTKKLLELMNEVVRVPGFGTLQKVETYNQAMANW